METCGESTSYFAKKSKWKKHILFSLTLLIICLGIYWNYIFGDNIYAYLDANDDTFQSYLAAYQMVVNWLKSGSYSFMDMYAGFGANLLAYQNVIFDPFAIILYFVGLVGGIEAIPYALVYMQIIKIICTAFACKYFLSAFSLSMPSQYVGALIYSLSAYMLSDISQHYWISTAVFFVVLVFGLIEHSNQNKKFLIALSITVTILCIWSVYFAYMILIAAGVYCIIRWMYLEAQYSWRKVAAFFLPLTISVIVGILMSAVIFIPTVFLMFGTSDRISSSTTLLETVESMFSALNPAQYLTMVLRLFSGQIQGNINNWGGADTSFNSPHLFCSVLMPLAFIQYIYYWIKQPKSRKKHVVLGSIIILAVFCLTQMAGIAMNAFVEYQTRYLYVLFPVFAYFIAWILDKIFLDRNINYPLQAMFNIVIILLILVGTKWDDYAAKISAVNAVLCLFGVFFLSFYFKQGRFGKRARQNIIILFYIVLICNVCIDGRVALEQNRNIISKNWYSNYGINKTVQKAVQLTGASGQDFWRLERNYLGWGEQQAFTYSEIGNYRGISFYNSLVSEFYADFKYKFLNINDDFLNTCGAYSFNSFGLALDPVLADIYGIKYVISDYVINDASWKLVQQIDEKYLYENTSLNSAGLLFDKWYSEEEYENADDIEKLEIRSQAIVLEDGLMESLSYYDKNDSDAIRKEIDYSINSDSSDNISVGQNGEIYVEADDGKARLYLDIDTTKKLEENSQITLSLNVTAEKNASISVMCDTGFGYSDVYWAQEKFWLEEKTNKVYNIKIPAGTQQIKIIFEPESVCRIQSMEVCSVSGSGYTNEGVSLYNDPCGGWISGEVTAEKDSALLIPVFYENGWKAYLDGQEVDIHKGEYAFITLTVPAGKHQVEIIYRTPGMKIGFCISAVGLALYVLLIIWVLKNTSKNAIIK